MSLATMLSCLAFLPRHSNAAPELISDTSLSTAGYFRLRWTADPDANSERQDFELQQATDAAFSNATTRYQGPDLATVISGLANQTYYYRVRQSDNPDWSKTVSVEVKHHSLTRAFAFFTLGIAMFLITVSVLIKGTRLNPQS